MADWERDLTPEKKLAVGMIPGYGGVFASYLQDRRDRELRRAAQFQDAAIEAAGLEPEDFLRQVADDERLSDLFWFAMDAAARTTLESKRRALGRILAQGVIDVAAVDETEIFLRTLAALEAVDFRLLQLLPSLGLTRPARVQDLTDLQTSGGLPRHILQPVLDNLVSRGLVIVDTSQTRDREPSEIVAYNNDSCGLTRFGDDLLRWLKEVG